MTPDDLSLTSFTFALLFIAWLFACLSHNVLLWMVLWPVYALAVGYQFSQPCAPGVDCLDVGPVNAAVATLIAYPVLSFGLLAVAGLFSSGEAILVERVQHLKGDGGVLEAAGIMNQRATGRNRGADVYARLDAGADWDVWRSAAGIWQLEQNGHNYGVHISFSDPQDNPVYDNSGCVVPTVKHHSRDGSWSKTAAGLETVRKSWWGDDVPPQAPDQYGNQRNNQRR